MIRDSVVQELSQADQRPLGPGVWLVPDGMMRSYGVKPKQGKDGREFVPFSWATEFPAVGEFMKRFPGHWIADRNAEVWYGGPFNPEGIYWDQYDRRMLVFA